MAELRAGFKIPQQFMTGAIAGAFSPVLVWLASFIEPLAQSLIAAIRDSLGGRAGYVTGTQIGEQLISVLTGNFPGLPTILVAALGGGVLVMLGSWIYRQSWAPKKIIGMKDSALSQMTLVLFYASLVATIVLSAFALPPIMVLVTLAINSIATAWFIVAVLGRQLNII